MIVHFLFLEQKSQPKVILKLGLPITPILPFFH